MIDKEPYRIMRMFDAIARRYDLLNRLLSFGRDVYWRNTLADTLADRRQLTVLDLASGTGDVLQTLAKRDGQVSLGIGVDMAANMLSAARQKLPGLLFVRANCLELSIRNACVDAVTIAFGLRNIPDTARALAEMHRVIKPGGRLLILEFSMPANAAIHGAYLLYFRHVLPVIGGIISGNFNAYQYLNASVERFPYGHALCDMIEGAGFSNVQARPLTAGIATLYFAEKNNG